MKHKVAEELEHLDQLVTSCFTNWKIGRDADGYERFIRAIEHLEHMIESHFESLQNQQEQLLLLAEELYRYVQNKDIIGISDVMEYGLKPFIREWRVDCQSD